MRFINFSKVAIVLVDGAPKKELSVPNKLVNIFWQGKVFFALLTTYTDFGRVKKLMSEAGNDNCILLDENRKVVKSDLLESLHNKRITSITSKEATESNFWIADGDNYWGYNE